jgi:hypothetical protein
MIGHRFAESNRKTGRPGRQAIQRTGRERQVSVTIIKDLGKAVLEQEQQDSARRNSESKKSGQRADQPAASEADSTQNSSTQDSSTQNTPKAEN